jgi:hypothetical protein
MSMKPSKPAAKPVTVAKSAKPRAALPAPPEFDEAVALATQVVNAEGACTAVRAMVNAYPTFKRGDVMEVAAHVGINPYTTSRQFQLARKAATP